MSRHETLKFAYLRVCTMSATTCLHDQVLPLLRQYSQRRDLRHLKALAWMVTALVCSGKLSLPEWEAYVPSRARQAQSTERRWQRFMGNRRVRVKSLYVPLVLAAIHQWKGRRLYLALDTTVLWNRYCMIHVSVTCCGRAVPLLWRVLEHSSATVSTKRYLPLLRLAHRLLKSYPDVMLLADRGFANHDLLAWLSQSHWHYCLRLPSDVVVHGPRRHPIEVGYLWPPKATLFWPMSKASRNPGPSSPMSCRPSIPCGNMPCGFESRSFSSIQNPGPLSWKPPAFVRLKR